MDTGAFAQGLEVLMQHDKVVACVSQQLKEHEKSYLVHDLKLAGIFFI